MSENITLSWPRGWKGHYEKGCSFKEDTNLTLVTILDYEDGNVDKMRLNRWIKGPRDPWILKGNLLIQPNNNDNEWMNLLKLENIGYQYVKRTYQVKKVYEHELRRKIDILTSGFTRKYGINLGKSGNLIKLIISRNIDAAILAIFCELNIGNPPPIDTLTSGYMRRNDGIHIIGIHKFVEKYIDKVSGMYLKWDRTCSVQGELLQGAAELKFSFKKEYEFVSQWY